MLYYLKFSFIKFDHKPILYAKWKIWNFGAYLNLIEWPDFGNEELSKIFNAKVRGSNRLDGVVWIDDSFAPSLFRNSKLGAQLRHHFALWLCREKLLEKNQKHKNLKILSFDSKTLCYSNSTLKNPLVARFPFALGYKLTRASDLLQPEGRKLRMSNPGTIIKNWPLWPLIGNFWSWVTLMTSRLTSLKSSSLELSFHV